jgi:hypothetical protein
MPFLRVVEVFPPHFPLSPDAGPLHVEQEVDRFVEGIRGVRDYADVFLIANNKNPGLLKLSAVEAGGILRDRLKVAAAPVVVVRDMNKPQFLSTVLSIVALGFDDIMLAWGDPYPSDQNATNVRDFRSLGEAIGEARRISDRAGASTRIFAPVDLRTLKTPKGRAMAESRLTSGADYLLAQPPTTDASGTLDSHTELLEQTSLARRVLLNVFPFRSEEDVAKIEKFFGWSPSDQLRMDAGSGRTTLLGEERRIAERIRKRSLPGIYVSTRGSPGYVKELLS